MIGEFIRDNGGNAWTALGVALERANAAEAVLSQTQAERDEWKARAEAAEEREARLESEYCSVNELADATARADDAEATEDALEAECERLRLELAEAQQEITAAQNETVWLRDAMNGSCALRDAAEARAECERLRAQVAWLRGIISNVADNMKSSRETWNAWHSDVALHRFKIVLDATEPGGEHSG